MSDPIPVHGARRAAVIFVFVTIVLDMVALSPGTRMHLPGAPFLLASMVLAMALGIAWRVTRETMKDESENIQPINIQPSGKIQIPTFKKEPLALALNFGFFLDFET